MMNQDGLTVTVKEFKAKSLELIDYVSRTGKVVEITKGGKVIAELHPPKQKVKKTSGLGFAKDTLKITGDIISPLDIEWDAMKDLDS
jgi:antitoxin (DNA-binding transcriptional repressor) of toxin-antitoxin stability system